jgi:hypothetical protein
VPLPPDDSSRLTSDIEEIWQHLANARGDAAREEREAAKRSQELEKIERDLHEYAERRRRQIEERRRRRTPPA